MFAKVVRVAAAAALALTASLVTVPAQADSSCPSSYACMWEDGNWGRGKIKFQYYIPDLAPWRFDNGHRANDAVSSVWNSGTRLAACFYEHKNGRGRYVRAEINTGYKHLGGEDFSDEISSAYFRTGNC